MEMVKAYEFTCFEWECPYCGHNNRHEGISKNDVVECERCDEESKISYVEKVE